MKGYLECQAVVDRERSEELQQTASVQVNGWRAFPRVVEVSGSVPPRDACRLPAASVSSGFVGAGFYASLADLAHR